MCVSSARIFFKFGTYDSLGAYQSKSSPYYDWYYFKKFPDEYACWWGCDNVPDLNKSNKDYRALVFGKNGVVEKLNALGGANGIGILDIVENRLIGMKDHGIYETPGGTILYFAHEQLEMLTLDKETLHMKEKLAVDYADLIYNGKWYSPLQEALTAFAKKSNEYCTGTVNIKLYKGSMINAGITSPYSLYSENLVTFGESDFNQAEAAGFINIWGLPTKVQALREQGKL